MGGMNLKKIINATVFAGVALLLCFLAIRHAFVIPAATSGNQYSIVRYQYKNITGDDTYALAPLVEKISKWPSKKACEEYLKSVSTEKIKCASMACKSDHGQFDKYFFSPQPTGEYFFVYSLKGRDELKNGSKKNDEAPTAKAVVVHFGELAISENERLNDLRFFINHEVVVNHLPHGEGGDFIVSLKVFSPSEEITALYSDLIKTEEWFKAKDGLDVGDSLFTKARQNSYNRESYQLACDGYWQAFQIYKGSFGLKDIQNAYNACDGAGDREKRTVFEKYSSEFKKYDTSAFSR